MAQLLDHVEALSRDIGPRPAGTEEEQQAALYIADALQTDAGFHAEIEDFTSSSNFPYIKPICGIVTIAFAVLSIFISALTIPAVILTIVSAAVYVAETLGQRMITQRLAKGASQNVVAKYVPHASEGRSARSRKVVLVAHYDTGRVKPGLETAIERLPLPFGVAWIYLGAMVAVPVFLLIHLLFFASKGNMPIVLAILVVIAVLLCAVALVIEVMKLRAPYNEGANDNATGVAVMLDVASAIGNGRVSEAELTRLGEDAVIHGDEAAREQDLVPDGAELIYEAAPSFADEGSEEQRLASAKAAIAALTGQPMPTRSDYTISNNLVQIHDETPSEIAPAANEGGVSITFADAGQSASEPEGAEEKIDASEAAAAAKRYQESSESSLPDWFVAAQMKAKKPAGEPAVARSRFADALDSAAEQSANAMEDAAQHVEEVPLVTEAPAQTLEVPEAQSEQAQPVQSEEVPQAPASDEAAQTQTAAPAVSKAASLPSFLDPWKTQAEALDKREEISRTAERVEVTGARITPDSRVDISDGAYIEDAATAAGRQDEALSALGSVEHRPVVLPEVDEQAAQYQAAGPVGQRAPLAVASEQSRAAAREMLDQVPGINNAAAAPAAGGLAPSRSGAIRSLRTKLPHLSGSMTPISGEETHVSSVSTVGSFVATSATGAFAPVGDELIEDFDADDIYIDDADDSDIEENYTESGAFAGPTYMEMPKSRAGGFFSKLGFGRKKRERELEESPQAWLDVDDSFDARDVGRQRGGWESFQNESQDYYDDDAYGQNDAYGQSDAYIPEDDFYDDYEEEPRGRSRRKWRGGAFSRKSLGRVSVMSSAEEDERNFAEAIDADIETPEEIKQIYEFRNPNFNTEVWFVALGSQVGTNDGINAFLAEHKSELRGAIVVELQSLGAGALSYVTEEGSLRKAAVSSRVSRFIKKAASVTGVGAQGVKLSSTESAASAALLGGTQAMRLVGIENGAPALSGSADDVVENVEVETLEDNAAFVVELVRSI